MEANATSVKANSQFTRIPVLGVVGAARSFDDLPIREWREMRPVRGARPGDRFCAARINGDSLAGDGILDGDYAIIRLTTDVAELRPGQLVAVFTPRGLLIKHIYFTLDHKVRLVSSNPDYPDVLLAAEDVTVQGVVVRTERDY